MYRILLSQPKLKNMLAWYTKTVTTTDETTGDITISQEIYETDSLEELTDEYLTLLRIHPSDAITPVDCLNTEIEAIITDITG